MFGISIGITSSAIGLKICAKATGSKRYKSMFKKRKTKHNEINSKVLIDSDINNDEFVVINKCAKRIWQDERWNKKFKDLIVLWT